MPQRVSASDEESKEFLPASPAVGVPILYQDDYLVVVDKPAWSIVHRTPGAEDALVLVGALRQQLGQRVFPAHRLDRQTSGVLVFALSSEAARRLSTALQRGGWQKRYLGLCRGVIAEPLEVDHPVPEGGHRREAISRFEPLAVFCNRYTLISAVPKTGRRHQLRYHLKHLRHPLVGDTNYGQGSINRFFRREFGLGRLFLHAESLGLAHPITQKPLQIDSPLPGELQGTLTKLSSYEGPVA